MDGRKKNSDLLFYIIVICQTIGLVARLLYIVYYPVPVRDSYGYAQFISAWNHSGSFPSGTHFPPLSVYLLKIPSDIYHIDIIKGGTIMNMIMGVMLIGLIVYLVSLLSPSPIFLFVAGLLVSTHSTFINYSCHMTRETGYLFFLTFALICIIKYFHSKRLYYIFLTSLSCSAACLCRFEALEFCFVVLLVLLIWKKRYNVLKCYLLFMLLYISFFFLISLAIGAPISYYYELFLKPDVFLKRVFNPSFL